MRLLVFAVLLLIAAVAQAGEIKGKVTNAVGGEALGRVEVTVLETALGKRDSAVTSIAGEFEIPSLSPGSYTLRLNAVGYRLLTIPFTLAAASDVKEFSIAMVPDNFHHTDKVEVRGDVFQGGDSPATVETTLTSTEIRETSTVFADDPFRAVQALPGVSAEGNNEFFAEFSVMGAPFSSVSIYIDDVLVPSPFHEIGNSAEGASLGVLTSEVVEEMKLLPAAYPEKFGDAVGAALDVRTREGSRGAPLFRLTAGIAASELLGEGGLGGARKGSWLVSARKSYINYLVQNRVPNAADVGFYDGDLKLNYDLTPRQNLSFFATDGHTDMTMTDPAALNIDEYASGKSDFALARMGWRWSLSPRLLFEARGAYFREPEDLRNTANQILNTTDYREWVGETGVTWNWFRDSVLEAGWTVRHLLTGYTSGFYDPTTGVLEGGDAYQETGLRQTAYAQESASVLKGRVHLLGSLRWDRSQAFLPKRFSPQGSAAVRVARATELQLSAGRYSQFTDDVFDLPAGSCVNEGALPPISNHYSAALEQRFGENTRIRLEAFQRKDFDMFGAIAPTQLSSNPCPALQPFSGGTYQRDYSQGVQLVVQRRSANRLSGWLGYTLLRARERQYQVTPPYLINGEPTIFFNTGYFPTLEDQRNSLNIFATYRLRPSLNLSGKWLYGSGYPIPSGSFVLVAGQYVPVGLNSTRLGNYDRLDLRIDKDWAFARWKLTLYGEVLNLTNHYNARYAYTSGVDPNTGLAQVKTLQGLPITPTAGLAFQF
jgi:hypothetical protein